MRAVVYDRYGPPEVLRRGSPQRRRRERTKCSSKILSTSVNLTDWECLVAPRCTHGLATAACGLPDAWLGHRRRVEAVGARVTRFRPGDEVYGDNLTLKGGFAEYAVAPSRFLPTSPRD